MLEGGENPNGASSGLTAGTCAGASVVRVLQELRSTRDTYAGLDLPRRLLRRFPAYLIALHEIAREGAEYVVSAELALRIGASAASVRKDLSYIGHWGRRSAGYRVDALTENLRLAAGVAAPRQAAWLGCERLTRCPQLIEEFSGVGCVISGVFCTDGSHVGRRVDGLIIRPAQDLPALVPTGLTVAVIATPDERAQAATELAVESGIRSVLNLTNKIIAPPPGAIVENVSPLQGLVSLLLRAPGADQGAEGVEPAEIDHARPS